VSTVTDWLAAPDPYCSELCHVSLYSKYVIGSMIYYFGSVSSPLCVWELERVCSQTQLCQLRRLMTILDNYMFRPLVAIFRLSLREFKVLLYNVRASWRDLYIRVA